MKKSFVQASLPAIQQRYQLQLISHTRAMIKTTTTELKYNYDSIHKIRKTWSALLLALSQLQGILQASKYPWIRECPLLWNPRLVQPYGGGLAWPQSRRPINKFSRCFSFKTVPMIVDQMLERVELMHLCHLIHRDIKPADFVVNIGRGSGNFF